MTTKFTLFVVTILYVNATSFGQYIGNKKSKIFEAKNVSEKLAIPHYYPNGATIEYYAIDNWMMNENVTYSYNSDKLVTAEIFRDMGNNYTKKTEYTYDSNKRTTSTIDYYWRDNKWSPNFKQEWEFNQNGDQIRYVNSIFNTEWSIQYGNRQIIKTLGDKVTENYQERWDMMTKQWVVEWGDKQFYYYDSQNNLVAESRYNYNDNKWNREDSSIYSYDSNKNTTEWIQFRDGNQEKTVLIYANGLNWPNEGLVYKLENGRWIKTMKYSDIQWKQWNGNPNNSEPIHYTVMNYDSISDTYSNNMKTVFTLYETGNLQVDFSWNKTDLKWDSISTRLELQSDTMRIKKKEKKVGNIWKLEELNRWSKQPDKEYKESQTYENGILRNANYEHTLFDANSNITERLNKYYDNNEWRIGEWYQNSFTYQAGTSKMLTKTTKFYDQNQSMLTYRNRYTFTYNPDNTSTLSFSNIIVTPTIFKSEIQIAINEPSMIQIIDFNGKILLQQQLNSTVNRLQLSFLSSGYYLLKVNNQHQSKIVKVVKQ